MAGSRRWDRVVRRVSRPDLRCHEQRQTGEELPVYGIHPICFSGEENHLNVMKSASDHMVARQQYPDAPIVFMGDFNAQDFDHSQSLLRHRSRDAYGRNWVTSTRFVDTFPAANGRFADAHVGEYPGGLHLHRESGRNQIPDQQRQHRRDAPGGSDHWPIMADVTL